MLGIIVDLRGLAIAAAAEVSQTTRATGRVTECFVTLILICDVDSQQGHHHLASHDVNGMRLRCPSVAPS